MEETLLIDELKQEQQKKNETIENKIEEITQVITSISQTISLIEQEMRANDLSYLQVSLYIQPSHPINIMQHEYFFIFYTASTLYVGFFFTELQ